MREAPSSCARSFRGGSSSSVSPICQSVRSAWSLRRSQSPQSLVLGHDVKLIPAPFVTPFRKSHKNDFRDAEAIAEVVQRPTMQFVTTKTVEHLDLKALHLVRTRLVSQMAAVANQIRVTLLARDCGAPEASLAASGSTEHSRSANGRAHAPHDAHDRGG